MLAANQVATKAAGDHKIVNELTHQTELPQRTLSSRPGLGPAGAPGRSGKLAEREGFEPSNTF